ncbi:MAG: peptidase M64 [Bacteroidales bacterium]|nr:peptidase M64 [Bacteroidales bacterium]MBR6865189.1 peptidase M64 [Bacteroidales bacterium]
MKRFFPALTALFLTLSVLPGEASVILSEAKESAFDTFFENATLRLDYVFCGDNAHQAIYFQQALRTSEWAGRRENLSEPLLEGNGQVRVLDPETGECLYANSFSTLFQEWQVTEEALHVQRAFENCFQVPFPKRPVDIEVFLLDTHRKRSSYLKHRIDPSDILIRKVADNGNSSAVVWQGGPVDQAIDIVVVSEGYDASEKAKFYRDAERVALALFGHEPFASRRDKFSVRAVFAPSKDSGVSVPRQDAWKRTVADTHFDTFYTDRYLTTSAQQKVYDLIGTVPFEHIVVMVNTGIYGGGGIYNSLTIMNSDHPTFVPVMVHEFGHAFGGLADEYAYGDQVETSYPADTEPWEPNITTLHDFAAKWQDMLPQGTPIPTEQDDLDKQDVRRIWHTFTPEQKQLLNLKLGVFEGAGYQSKGVYRPVQECRMRINECEEFCPVCTRAIVRMIEYYTR